MINVSKGLDLPISGSPAIKISDEPKISSVAVLSNDFVGMKPTMFVKVNDKVKVGQKIFEDKKNPGVYFTSPAGGTVKSINRGAKRRFLSIEIDIDANEEYELFNLGTTTNEIKTALLDSGLWNGFRTRPFNRTPKVDDNADAVFINCCDTNPLSVDPYEIIKEDKSLFDEGIKILSKLFDCEIHLTYQNNRFDTSNKDINYHHVSGPHPAGLSSTHISKIYPVSLKRIVWTINYQDIISIGYLFKNYKIRTHKIIALGGPNAFEPSLIKVRPSANIDEITAGKTKENSRLISGSVLHGHTSEGVMNYLGYYDSQISCISDELNDSFMSWLNPGSKLHSKLNVFLSSIIKPKDFIFNTSNNGANRAIVPISSYEEVVPMDILVTQLLKALVVSDTEMSVELGMLELVPEDLALCSYVCPSKYDYSSILIDNLNKLYSEL